jgi:hypothetical protein
MRFEYSGSYPRDSFLNLLRGSSPGQKGDEGRGGKLITAGQPRGQLSDIKDYDWIVKPEPGERCYEKMRLKVNDAEKKPMKYRWCRNKCI